MSDDAVKNTPKNRSMALQVFDLAADRMGDKTDAELDRVISEIMTPLIIPAIRKSTQSMVDKGVLHKRVQEQLDNLIIINLQTQKEELEGIWATKMGEYITKYMNEHYKERVEQFCEKLMKEAIEKVRAEFSRRTP